METFRSKRSKISTITPHRAYKERAFTQGNRQVQNQRNFTKLASDSSSCSSDTVDEDSFTFELGLRSSKQAAGTPIKKLLAKEMSKETESKRRSPSVVAKLMGLDGLPPQQPGYKEEKGKPEDYFRTIRPVEKGQRSSRRYDSRPSRKSSKDEQEFKDVFEVLETSKAESCSFPSQGTVNSNLTEAQRDFIKQKFMDAKRLSTDEKFHGSKEFHEALEVLDSNKDLLLKFLQQPDSLFTKHLRDLQGSTPQPLCGRIAAMKSSEAQMCEKTHLDSKSTKERPHKSRSASSQRRTSHSDCYAAQKSVNSSKNQLEGKEEPAILPTRIVVLKPNLGKVLSVSNAALSHASISECRKDIQIPIIKNREVELLGRRNFHRDVGHKSTESRELAKEITRQMKNSFRNSSKFSSSAFKGYAGDESSCSMSGNESANESETMSMSSKCSLDLNNQHRPLSSRSTESSVSREAKKRLSERWKLTHKSLDMSVVSRGSTLAEMLAIPDKETRPAHLDSMTDQEGFRNKIACDDRPSGWVEPLGISSRDGWKDGCIGSLTRSRSLPSSSTAFGSPRAIMRREPIRDDRFVIPKEALKRERNKAQNKRLDKKSVNRNSRSSGKKSYPSHSIGESNDSSTKNLIIQNQAKIKLEVNGLSEQKIEDIESLAGDLVDMCPVPKSPVDGERETTMSSDALDNLLPESPRTVVADVCHAGDQDDPNLQEPLTKPREEGSLPLNHSVPGLDSPASSKETEQPSPVSILEVPFTDDVSSCSECFESLSADLQGLRMQLQLLKLESESYEEGPMLISSDDEVGEGSTEVSDAIGLSQQSWESCYMVDVLMHSGLNDADPDRVLAAWHTPDCPLSPSVFEELEKKYNDQTCPPKTDRKLLFDRLSCAILEMYKPFTDPHPWIKSTTRTMLGPRWSKDELQNGLLLFLASQVKNVGKDATERVLGRESEWMDMRDDIDIIGREIETLLLDELVEELVAM